jgi:hypothetical protein
MEAKMEEIKIGRINNGYILHIEPNIEFFKDLNELLGFIKSLAEIRGWK